MRTRFAALALATSLFAASSASAQTHFTFVNGGTTSAYGYSVGPYAGLMGNPGSQQSVVLNCVDFFHHVYAGQQWDANLSSLATGTGIGTWSRSGNINLYKEAAYLTNMYGTAGINSKDIGNIQISIWNLFANTNLSLQSGGTKSGSYWLTQAAANYGSMNMNGWFVVTDVNKQYSNSVQEFLMWNPSSSTVSPEPASLALFGTGFAGLAAFRVRRKRKS